MKHNALNAIVYNFADSHARTEMNIKELIDDDSAYRR